jgi:putative ABC transport system permease protein
VQDIDPEIGMVEMTTMSSEIGNSIWRERFSALLVGIFAALAVILASGGLYAVISHAVERRSHELGLRLALGANTIHIARAILGHGIRVWAIGVALGILLALTAGRLLMNQAYQLSDLSWMFPVVASLLLILTILACWFPFRRALAVDPLMTLKSE